jgi:phosphotransferase system enzyme I (PtsI)
LAVGTVYTHDHGDVHVPRYDLPQSKIPAELNRFEKAIDKANDQLETLKTEALAQHGTEGEEIAFLLEAYQHMLEGSRLLRGVQTRIRADMVNAEAAVADEMRETAQAFAAMEDQYLAGRGKDVQEVGKRLLRCLTDKPYRPFSMLPDNAIIVAHDLTPADTALLDPKKVAGFVIASGGVESHTAIMARSLGLPAVVSTHGIVDVAQTGMKIVLDGLRGDVILNPSVSTRQRIANEVGAHQNRQRALAVLRDKPAQTQDGRTIAMMVNLELPSEIASAADVGAEGIGLFRSEFIFLNRGDLPSVQEQAAFYTELVENMDGKPVTIRVLDVGGDKLGAAIDIPPGPNPVLGLRAIRMLLSRQDIFMAQAKAILLASRHGPVRILLPMVCSVHELTEARRIIAAAADELVAEGYKLPASLPPIGVMIEIPGAAMIADSLSYHADFMAIGTNDLTQYTLAIDRADDAVSHLYNSLHPAVLRLIQLTAEAGRRRGIAVSVCGELAGDPLVTPVLLGLGIEQLSMAAGSIPRVKETVRALDNAKIQRIRQAVMADPDPDSIRAYLQTEMI